MLLKRTSDRRALFTGLLFLALVASASADDIDRPPSRRERQTWAERGQELHRQKNYAAAVVEMERAVSPGVSEKDLNRWLPVLGRCYESLGNFQKAITVYQQAHGLKPKSMDRMLDLARVYARVDLFDQAMALYEKVHRRDRHRKDVLLAMAELRFKTGRLDLAKELVDIYLKWEPRDMTARRLLAEIYESSGDWAAAAHEWEGILAISPSGNEYFHLGQLWGQQGQFDLASRSFEKAEKLGYSAKPFVLEHGILAWRKGDIDAASRYWREALKGSAESALAEFMLAFQEYQQGRVETALAGMRRVFERPGDEYIKELAKSFVASVEAVSGSKKSGVTQ